MFQMLEKMCKFEPFVWRGRGIQAKQTKDTRRRQRPTVTRQASGQGVRPYQWSQPSKVQLKPGLAPGSLGPVPLVSRACRRGHWPIANGKNARAIDVTALQHKREDFFFLMAGLAGNACPPPMSRFLVQGRPRSNSLPYHGPAPAHRRIEAVFRPEPLPIEAEAHRRLSFHRPNPSSLRNHGDR